MTLCICGCFLPAGRELRHENSVSGALAIGTRPPRSFGGRGALREERTHPLRPNEMDASPHHQGPQGGRRRATGQRRGQRSHHVLPGRSILGGTMRSVYMCMVLRPELRESNQSFRTWSNAAKDSFTYIYKTKKGANAFE